MTTSNDSIISALRDLADKLASERRWGDAKAAQMALGLLLQHNHPIMGDDDDFDADTWSRIVD